MTQLEAARKGIITEEMKEVAKREGIEAEELRQRIAKGTVIIPRNKNRKNIQRIEGIGEGLRVKVNANIGTSSDYVNYDEEMASLRLL